jgi:hypothetical protein
MKLRQSHRTALVCAIYVASHFLVRMAAPAGRGPEQVYILDGPGRTIAFLLLCGPRYAGVVFATQVAGFFLAGSAVPGLWFTVLKAAVSTVSLATAAWLIGRRLDSIREPRDWRDPALLLAVVAAAPLPWGVLQALLQYGGLVASPGHVLNDIIRRGIAAAAALITVVPATVLWIVPWYRGEPRPPAAPLTGPAKTELAGQ